MYRYLGLDTVFTQVIDRMGDEYQIGTSGNYAGGKDTVIIDIAVVGSNENAIFLSKIKPRIRS